MDMYLKGELLGIDVVEKVVDMNIFILFIIVFGEEFYKWVKNFLYIVGYLVKFVYLVIL